MTKHQTTRAKRGRQRRSTAVGRLPGRRVGTASWQSAGVLRQELDRRDLGSRRIVRKIAAGPTTDFEDTARQCTSHACAYSRQAAPLHRLIERFIELRPAAVPTAIHCVRTLTAL
jgi:hypothetical protein